MLNTPTVGQIFLTLPGFCQGLSRLLITSYLLLTLLVSLAWAEPHRWEPLTTSDYVWIGGLLGGTYAVQGISTGPFGNWQGGVLFDDSIRNGLRASSLRAREQASQISDVGLVSLVTLPFILNAGILSSLKYSDLTGAGRIALITLESYSFSIFAQQLISHVSYRSRPAQLECLNGNSGYYPDCGTVTGFNSFFSGHTSMAFTAAGLVCRHNESLELISNPLERDFVCGGALAVAGGVGLLRIVSDRHYFSDVLTGGLVGFFSGYLLPVLLHETQSQQKVRFAILPIGNRELSLQASYSF
jgi:membrane-associated phospholipid phosphatase